MNRFLATSFISFVCLSILSGCSLTPLPEVSLEVQPQIAVNGFHSVFVDNAGTVWTWGDNRFGQLGNGQLDNNIATSNSTPVQLSGLPAIASVAIGGSHTLALTTDGQVWAWGHNADNTLGVTTDDTIQTTPVLIAGLDHITAIAAGDGHGLALRSDGAVWTWGINTDGQTGLPQTGNHPFPEEITVVTDVIAIAAGDAHSLLLRADGTVWATGLNNFGQLGDGTTESRSEFAEVTNLEHIVAIDAGETYSLALDAYGDIWGFGNATLGQLGPNNSEAITSPQRIMVSTSGQPYRAISAGGSHVMALDDAGLVWSWGYNGFGQLGYETNDLISAQPQLIPLQDTISGISAGDNHSAVFSTKGNIWIWGDNQFGQLGDGTFEARFAPQLVTIIN